MSPSSLSILGYHPDEMIGRNATEFLYPEDLDAPATRCGWRDVVAAPAISIAATSTETVAWCRWCGPELVEPEREYFFIGRDMTERPPRTAAAPGTEDGGDGTADRRHRPRLQQHPDVDHQPPTRIGRATRRPTPQAGGWSACTRRGRGARRAIDRIACWRSRATPAAGGARLTNLNETVARMVRRSCNARSASTIARQGRLPRLSLWVGRSPIRSQVGGRASLNLAVNARDAMP